MQQIVEMKRTTPVMPACEYRNQIIRYQDMVINEDDTTVNREAFQLTLEKHWIPNGRYVQHFFSMFAVCPFYVEKVRVGDTRDWMRVPRMFEDNAFDIESVQDEKTDKPYLIFWDKVSGKEIKHIAFSTLHSGPQHHSPYFDSECGAVLKTYLEYEELRTLVRDTMKKEANPPVYIRREVPATSQPNDIIEQKLDEILQLYARNHDSNGYAKPDEVGVKLDKGDGFIALPKQYNTVGNVHRPNTSFDETFHWNRLVQVVSAVFKIPRYILESNKAGSVFAHSRSESATEEDRALVNNACTNIAHDVSIALRTMWEAIYKDEDIPVYIPIRPFLDIQAVRNLYDFGAMEKDAAVEYLLRMYGLAPQTGREGKRRRSSRNDEGSKEKKNKPDPDALLKDKPEVKYTATRV